MRMHGLAIAASLTLVGCATSEPSSPVTVVGTQQALDGCTYVASVRGDQNMIGGVLQAAAYEDALNQMKAKTVTAGGNRLFLTSSNVGWGGANLTGDAYNCPQR